MQQRSHKDIKRARGNGVIHVGSLFEKYTKILRAPQGVVLDAVIVVVEDVCGHTLKKQECAYNPVTQVLTLKTSGLVRTEVMFKKKEILATLRDVLGEKNAPKNIL